MKTLSTQCPSRPSLVAVFNLCPWLSLYWIKPTPLSAWPTKSTRNHLSYFSNFHFPGQIPSRIILDRSIVVYLAGHNPASSHCSRVYTGTDHIYIVCIYIDVVVQSIAPHWTGMNSDDPIFFFLLSISIKIKTIWATAIMTSPALCLLLLVLL